MSQRQPEHLVPIEAELAILGAAMLNAAVVSRVRGTLRAEDFVLPLHQHAWTAILQLVDAGDNAFGAVAVATQMAAGGNDGALDAMLAIDNAGTAVNAEVHARLVREAADRRRLIDTCQRTIASVRGPEGVAGVDAIASALRQSVGAISAARGSGEITAADAFAEAWAALERGDDGRTIRTGLADLDAIISGLAPQNLIVIGARPAMGKTSLAMKFVLAAAQRGETALVASLEMSAAKLARRVLAVESRTNINEFDRKQFRLDFVPKLEAVKRRLERLPILFTETVDIDQIEAAAHRAAAGTPRLALVVIDYLGLVEGGDGRGTREQEVARISRRCKLLAKQLNICVVLLAQLSRKCEERPDKRPRLSDLRESGAIEQDADIVLFIYRDEKYNPATTTDRGIAELNVAKQRDGATGVARVRFNERWTRFDNLDDQPPATSGWTSRGGR